MKESVFQKKIIAELYDKFPGVIVLKNDPGYRQGIPDLIVLCGNRFALLEVKTCETAHKQPNQEYYIDKIKSSGGFAAFIYPENKEAVYEALARTFGFCQ